MLQRLEGMYNFALHREQGANIASGSTASLRAKENSP